MKKDSTLLRLRKANPYPLPATVDESELLTRITARPPDSRLRGRATPRHRRGLVLALSLVVMVLLASTAYALSTWVFPSSVKPEVTALEYRRAQHELPLPPGYSWPVLHFAPNSVTGKGAGGGHAVLISQNAWECYWVDAIRKDDKAAQRRARRHLDTLLAHNMIVAPRGAPEDWRPANPPEGPYAVWAFDGGLTWFRGTYKLASGGDPRRLIQSCLANSPR
jgi:hypothetical protein